MKKAEGNGGVMMDLADELYQNLHERQLLKEGKKIENVFTRRTV